MPHDLFSRWRYSTRLLFSGCDRATYQQDLVVHRAAGRDHEEVSGGLKVWHIYIGPRCRADYGDLRFSGRYGRELAYYLWPGYDSSSARIAVRLEGADRSGALTVHYGNPSATTTSDGEKVFAFFDDMRKDRSSRYTPSGGWNYDAVNHYIRATSTARIWIAGLTVSDFVMTVDMKSEAGSRDTYSLGLMFRASSESSGYYYNNDPATGPNYRLGRLPSTVLASSGSIPPPGAFHSIRITALGPQISAQAEGFPLLSATDTTHASGGVILVADVHSTDIKYFRNIIVRAHSATPPSLLRTSRGVNPAYAGLARLTGSAAADDGAIQFAGVGSILVVGDERETIAGAGSFAIETSVRSSIPIAGAVGLQMSLHLVPAPATPTGTGGVISEPARLHTPLGIEAGEGSAYVAPTPVQFDLTKYRFSSLTISRSAQDALWQCEGRIVGLDAPLAYKQFEVRVPDHNGVLRTLFVGFVPGRDYVRAVTADESIIQGYDAGFYLTRQYLPDGDLTYPRVFGWGPARLLHYFLGEESVNVYSRSRWEQITGIMPYRLENPPSYYEWPYSSRIDWVFQPKTTKAQAIQEICEKSGLVFLVKWRKIHGAWTPCAYLVPEEDIDHPTRGLDLPDPVTFTHPDPHVMDYVRVTMRSDEKYNRIEVRSASPSGAWFHAVRETPALQAGEELPIEYLEERSDLPIDADHGGWCNARADELYAYYTAYAYTYTLTLINRVDLELYQRCRFYGFDAIPSGEMMRIVAITYNVLPTHTEVEITVTPDSRLSDLRKLQRSQAADSVSEVQTIAQSQIDRLAAGEVGTVVGIDGAEAIVELERKADSSVRGRIV